MMSTNDSEGSEAEIKHAPDRPVGTVQDRKVNRNAIRASLHERGFIGIEVQMFNRDYALVDIGGVPEPRQEVVEAYFDQWDAAHPEPNASGLTWGIEI